MKARARGPGAYAKVVPRIRALIPKLAGEERVREILSQPGLEEALGFLRDTVYAEGLQAEPPWLIQARIMGALYRRAQLIASLSPPEAARLARAFIGDDEARDAFTLLEMLETGEPRIEELPTAHAEGTILYRARRDPEVVATPQRLQEYLAETWLAPYLALAQRLRGELGPYALRVAGAVAGIAGYLEAIEKLDPRLGAPWASRILCPLLSWRITAILLALKERGAGSRTVAQLFPKSRWCRLAPSKIRSIYEREQDPRGLAASIREAVPHAPPIDQARDLDEALGEARREARARARRAARASLQSYPFHAGLVAGGLTLLKLDAEDLATVLTGIRLGMDPERILALTAYKIVL